MPRAAELTLAITLRGAISRLAKAVLGMPLERFAQQPERTDAADGDSISIPGADEAIRGARRDVAGISGNVADKIENNNRSEFKRLGIDLRQAEPKFGKLIEGWRSENVDRVTSLVGFERDKLSDILAKGENKTVAELRSRIEARLDVSRSKADLLARDQVLKLNAKITRERHAAAGITEYIWTTAGDERVRETHDELDGETFSWDDPPVTNDAGDRNHPGEDYQCRCIPYPVLPELGDDEGGGDEQPATEEQPPEAAPAEDNFAPPAEPPLVARRDEFIKALGSPDKNGPVIRDILREQVKSVLPETVSQDTSLGRRHASTVTVNGTLLQRLGANATHSFEGEITVSRALLDRAKRGLALEAAGAKASITERDAVRTLLHEEMHGHSRASWQSYKGIGAKLEEVGTELNARRLTSDVFGSPVTVGSYQAYIDQVANAVRVGMKALGSPVLIEEAEALIANAHVKGVCSGGSMFSTPTEALLEFAQALDVTPDQRAAILAELRKL